MAPRAPRVAAPAIHHCWVLLLGMGLVSSTALLTSPVWDASSPAEAEFWDGNQGLWCCVLPSGSGGCCSDLSHAEPALLWLKAFFFFSLGRRGAVRQVSPMGFSGCSSSWCYLLPPF